MLAVLVAHGAPMTETIDYGNLMHRAMRGLIQNVLIDVGKTGFPGNTISSSPSIPCTPMSKLRTGCRIDIRKK